jgi:uncharacterized protein (DUF2141 family)
MLWKSPSSVLYELQKTTFLPKLPFCLNLYDTKETFFKKPLSSKTVKASNQSLEFSFDLSEGEYAVAVYQDINENKLLDKGLFSIPKEPFGLSNNFRPSFSAPTFNDCNFKLAQQATITITIK